MHGTVNDWKQATGNAEDNAQYYQVEQVLRPNAGTPTRKGLQFRELAWADVAKAIAEALRLESLPVHES